MSLTEILIFLLGRKKYSLGIPFLAGVLGFVIAWVLPPYYKSEIKVFLDTGSKTTNISSLIKNATSSNFLGSLGAAGMGAVGMGSGENEDLYIEIIGGRDVLLATIEKFKLDTIYKSAKYKETLIKQFDKDIKIKIDELTGIVSCEYEAKNKELARDLVRFVVEEANAKYIKLRKERALQTIEQLNSFKQSILASADSISEILVKFYRDNNLLDLESQLKLTITALAGYEEQIKNMKISESRAGTDNSTATELRKRREILERESQKLRGDFSEDYLPSRKSVYINSDWAVEKLIEQEKLGNDLKRIFATLEMIEGSIVLEEGNAAKNLPVIQVVQDAYLADYKSKPKRATWAVAAAVFGFAIISMFLILQGIYYNKFNCEQKTRDSFINLLKAIKP
jgi:capsule polysaccharide export protein KpsE/RkpR